MGYWHPDVVEGYIGCAGSGRIGRLDSFGFDIVVSGNKYDGKAFLREYQCSTV